MAGNDRARLAYRAYRDALGYELLMMFQLDPKEQAAWQAVADALDGERIALRKALVTICNLVGGQASPDVSSEFLAHVPAEAEAFITRLREDKARLEWALRFATSEQWSTIRELAAGDTEKARTLIDQAMGKS